MRKMFSHQLIEARHEMLSIYEALDLSLHDAVQAFVTDDTELANKAKEKSMQIEARCDNLEVVCYNLISMQGPVASDFRTLQTIVYVNFNMQRMCDKVRRIARAAKRKVKSEISLPQELVDLIQREASCVYRVLGLSVSALVDNDLSVARALLDQDEPVHKIYEEFFRTYNRMSTEQMADEDALDDLRRVIMVARYLDRIASISIDASSRIIFLLTGQRWSLSDVAEAGEDELEEQRIPSGEGTILNPDVDARYVAKLPLDEVDEKLANRIKGIREQGAANEE